MRKLKLFTAAVVVAVISLFAVGCGLGDNSSNYGDMTWVIQSNYDNVVSITSIFDGVKTTKMMGSGVLVYKDGYIATNAHVITLSTGNNNHRIADRVEIKFWSDAEYDGTWVYDTQDQADALTRTVTLNYNQNNPNDPANEGVLYWDIHEDIAILKCDDVPAGYENNYSVLRDSSPDHSPLKMGEPVAALGWSLGEMYSCSVGVVTSLEDEFKGTADGVDKDVYYAIFHDARTIQGNSGGPLFDAQGRVIGLNTMIVYLNTTDDSVQTPGFDFSIAISSRTILAKMKGLGII